jgi:hypothetical protein
MTSPGIRLVEIAELLSVSKQRAHQIAEERLSGSCRRRRSRPTVEPMGGAGVGEALAH